MKPLPNPDRKPKKSDSVVWREIEGEHVIVPIHCEAGAVNSIYVANETGARIWELIDGNRTLAEIRDMLASEFDLDPGEAGQDLGEFIAQLDEVNALEKG